MSGFGNQIVDLGGGELGGTERVLMKFESRMSGYEKNGGKKSEQERDEKRHRPE
jgi:hypothetical protein